MGERCPIFSSASLLILADVIQGNASIFDVMLASVERPESAALYISALSKSVYFWNPNGDGACHASRFLADPLPNFHWSYPSIFN